MTRVLFSYLYKVVVYYCFVPLLFTGAGNIYGQNIPASINSSTDILSPIDKQNNKLQFRFRTGEINYHKVLSSGEEYFSVRIPGFTSSSEPGNPAVPVYTRIIDITGKEIAAVKINKTTSKRLAPPGKARGVRMMPRQPGLSKNQDPQVRRPLVKNHDIYSKNIPAISDTVIIEETGTIRGRKLAQLKIYPLVYYPLDNNIDLITDMTFTIETKSTTSDHVYNTGFSSKGLFDKGIDIYDNSDVPPLYTNQPSTMVLLSDTSMKDVLSPLVKWKRIKGFNVIELYVGENGLERDYSAIKDTLEYIWDHSTADNPQPDFLLIAGHLNLIPSSVYSSEVSDLYYAEFDGNEDYLPDMYYGRIPARDTAEMKSVVDKILQYERFEFGDTIDHYNDALLLTGFDTEHAGWMNGQLNYASDYYLNEGNNVNPDIYLHEIDEAKRTVNYDSVKAILNRGVGFVNYTGHGNEQGWADTGIDYRLPENLRNSSRYPVIISNACLTGDYSTENNLGASFVRARNKGALAFIGCSVNSYWDEDYWWAVGLTDIAEIGPNPLYEKSGLGSYDRLFHLNDEDPSEWYTSLGQVLFAGNLSVLSSNSSYKSIYWRFYNLQGDPSIVPFIGTPTSSSAIIPDTIPPGLKCITLEANPFSYAAVSSNDTLWDAATVSPERFVTLDLKPEKMADSCLVIICGQNTIPAIKTVYFAETDTAWLNIYEIRTNDSRGNNNDSADYAETISLDIDLQNAGQGMAGNTYLKASSSCSSLNITVDSVFIGNISSLQDFSISDVFEIIISDSIPDGLTARLNVDLYYNEEVMTRQTYDFEIHSPIPTIVSVICDDTAKGNGNMQPEQGEEITLIIKISNRGTSNCEGFLSIPDYHPSLNITPFAAPTGIMAPGDTMLISIEAGISSDAPSKLSFLPLLQCGRYADSSSFSLFPGKIVEDFETNSFELFNWENNSINPWLTGTGQKINNSFGANSGLTLSSDSSNLTLKINLPEKDTLSFWYTVSSEPDYDHFRFYLNNRRMVQASGEQDWKKEKIIIDKGIHILKWQYFKDKYISQGDDRAAIDLISFPDISFLHEDIAVLSLASPVDTTATNIFEKVSAEVLNLGQDTVFNISLSYDLNHGGLNTQTFITVLAPGDTTRLDFDKPVTMTETGTYDIRVFNSRPDEYLLNDTAYVSLFRTGFAPGSHSFTVGPNPFVTTTVLTCLEESTNVRFTLYGSSGSTIYKFSRALVARGERIELNRSWLPSGIYILKIETDKGNSTYKIMKL